jgi:hypothetical protein
VRCLPQKINAYGSIQEVIFEAGSSLLFSKPPSRLSPQNKRRPIALLFILFRLLENPYLLFQVRIFYLDVNNLKMVYLLYQSKIRKWLFWLHFTRVSV